MLGNALGDQERVGLDTRRYDSSFLEQSPYFNDRYDLARFDPHGCQADLTIARASGAGETGETAFLYNFYRLFQPDRLDRYIRGLVTIQVAPKSTPYATGCSQ
jgi:hypothetical protein